MTQNMDALLGPSGKSDYSVGDRVTYMYNGQMHTGTIEWIEAPGVTPVTKTPHPTQYWVSDGGMPDCIYQTDIVVE